MEASLTLSPGVTTLAFALGAEGEPDGCPTVLEIILGSEEHPKSFASKEIKERTLGAF